MCKRGLSILIVICLISLLSGCRRDVTVSEMETGTTERRYPDISEPYIVYVDVWVPEEIVGLTDAYVEKFFKEHTEYSTENFIVEVQAASTQENVNEILTDVECAPSLYCFRAEDLESVVNAGGLYWLTDSEYEQFVVESNCEDSVDATRYEGKIYAFPMATDDNTGEVILLGVKPQTEQTAAIVCLELAKGLTSYEVQKDIYKKVGWEPTNMEARKNFAQ